MERSRATKLTELAAPTPIRHSDPLGLTLGDDKTLLAGVQRHLDQGRVAEYSALRRTAGAVRPSAR
jgi:hypothetical protein